MVTISFDEFSEVEKEVVEGFTSGKIVDGDDEYRELVNRSPTPEGYRWSRTPFGAPLGKYKAYVKEDSNPDRTDTDLERELRSQLMEWGYWKFFEQDVSRLGRQLDFADVERKIAIEPGAVYWHTPEESSGEGLAPAGETPKEVFSPVKETDSKKQNVLEDSGWKVLWVNEEGIQNNPNVVKQWLQELYDR